MIVSVGYYEFMGTSDVVIWRDLTWWDYEASLSLCVNPSDSIVIIAGPSPWLDKALLR